MDKPPRSNSLGDIAKFLLRGRRITTRLYKLEKKMEKHPEKITMKEATSIVEEAISFLDLLEKTNIQIPDEALEPLRKELEKLNKKESP